MGTLDKSQTLANSRRFGPSSLFGTKFRGKEKASFVTKQLSASTPLSDQALT